MAYPTGEEFLCATQMLLPTTILKMMQGKSEALWSFLFLSYSVLLVEGQRPRPSAAGARAAGNSDLSTGAIVGIVIASVLGPPVLYGIISGIWKACTEERYRYPAYVGKHSVIDVDGKVINSNLPVDVKALPAPSK